MKKFLALVLALVMTMSLVTIAGAEDFTDADAITYEEAVDVMTAIDVVGGYADGSFNPTAGLTRGAAAKIICNMILGPTTAEALNADAAPFSDVAVDNVFAGYIAYCAKEGIISGYADGTFKPAAPLTGYAFMKMLLGALGYDANIEGYVGANWSINVAKRALNIGLDKGLDGNFVGTKALTREEACLYAFNTLKATMVTYGNRTSISVGDIVVTSQADAAEVLNATADYNLKDSGTADEATLQFCEKFFSDLYVKAGEADDFTRGASRLWFVDENDNGTYQSTVDTKVINVLNTPVVTYTAKTSAATIAEDLAGYWFVGTKLVNKNTCVATAGSEGELSFTTTTSIASTINAATANGKVVEIYANADNEITDIEVLQYKVEKVLNVTENLDGDVTYVLSLSGSVVDYADEDANDSVVLKGEFVKDEIVTTIVGDNSGDVYVYETEKFVGTQSSRNQTTNKLTIDGSVYTVATGVLKDNSSNVVATTDFANDTSANNYYVDQYGFVVYTDADAETNYAAVIDIVNNYAGGAFEAKDMIKLVLADGSVVETEYKTTADGELTDVTDEGKVVTYTVENGKYVVALASTDNGISAITNNVATLKAAVYGDEETIFVVRSGAGTTADPYTYKAYEGIKAVPSMTSVTAKAVVDTLHAEFVYVSAATMTGVTTTNATYITSVEAQQIKEYAEDGVTEIVYYIQNAIVDGVYTTVKTNSLMNGVYSATTTNKDGVITGGTSVDGLAPALSAASVVYEKGVLNINGGFRGVIDSAVCYMVAADGTISQGVVAGLVSDLIDYDGFYTLKDGIVTGLYLVPLN